MKLFNLRNTFTFWTRHKS